MVPDPDQVVVLDSSRLRVGPAQPGHEVMAAVLEHAVFPDVVDAAAFVVAHDVERVAGMRCLQLQRKAREFRVRQGSYVGMYRLSGARSASSIFLDVCAMNSYLPDTVCIPSR